MNKASVFLLVVVSSLLTYISTANQPASSTGFAPVKWEFSKFTSNTKSRLQWLNDAPKIEATGIEGYELFQVDNYGSENTTFWFRRPVR